MSTLIEVVLLIVMAVILLGWNIYLHSKIINLQILLDARAASLRYEIDLLKATKADKRRKVKV